MANTEKEMSLKWEKIRSAVSECEAVDQQVVDLCRGARKMPLSEAAERVKEAVGVVRTYVTGVHAVVAAAKSCEEFTIVDQASEAKDDLYAAIEGLRGVIAEVKDEGLTSTWDDIKEQQLPDFSSDGSDTADAGLKDGFQSQVKCAAEHVSSVSDAMKEADGAANSALAVVALAKREATRAVDEALDGTALRAARRCFRRSVSATNITSMNLALLQEYVSMFRLC